MRRAALALAAVAAAVPMAGCAAGQGSAPAGLQGDEKAVAQLVSDLSDAGRRKQPAKICTEILAPALAARLKTPQGDCVEEMTKAIDDADDYRVDVKSVQVTGTQAQAVVQQGDKGPRTTFRFAKQGGGWRVTDLGG